MTQKIYDDVEIIGGATGEPVLRLLNRSGSVLAEFNGTARQTYAATNVTTDRTFDADTVDVAELADIVGTLIADLRARGIIT